MNQAPIQTLFMKDHMDLFVGIKTDNQEVIQNLCGTYSPNLLISFEQVEDDSLSWILDSMPTLLDVCLFYRAKECTEFLLMADASLIIPDRKNRYPIHFAAAGGSIEILRLLEQYHDFNPDLTDSSENFAAHYAAKFNQLDAFYWLDVHAKPVNPMNASGATPFMWACSNGAMKIIKFLYNGHVKINRLTIYGKWAPIHYACSGNQTEALKFLLEQPDIIIDMMKKNEDTPMIQCIESNALDCLKLLLEQPNIQFTEGTGIKGRKVQLLHHPILKTITTDYVRPEFFVLIAEKSLEQGSLTKSIIDECLQKCFQVPDGILMLTVIIDFLNLHPELSPKSLQKLITESVRLKDDGECFETLSKWAGFDPTIIQDFSCDNLLHVAILSKRETIIPKLVEKGVDINGINSQGQTPLMCAYKVKKMNIADYLRSLPNIDLQYNINWATKHHQTAFLNWLQNIH